jgi:hypothetical protein
MSYVDCRQLVLAFQPGPCSASRPPEWSARSGRPFRGGQVAFDEMSERVTCPAELSFVVSRVRDKDLTAELHGGRP